MPTQESNGSGGKDVTVIGGDFIADSSGKLSLLLEQYDRPQVELFDYNVLLCVYDLILFCEALTEE